MGGGSLVQTFSCPSCGGSLEYGGSGRTMTCPYCGTVAQVAGGAVAANRAGADRKSGEEMADHLSGRDGGSPHLLRDSGDRSRIGGGLFAAIIPFILGILGR